MDEEQIRKVIEAMSGMSDSVSDVTEKLNKNKDAQDSLIAEIKKTNEVADKQILLKLKENAALLQGEKAYIQQMQALGLTRNALGEFERVTVKITAEQKKRIAEEQAITDRQRSRDEMSAKIHQMMADKTGTLIKGLQAFGEGLNKTIFDGSRGQSKYGEVLDDAGGKVQALGTLFGPLGKALTFTTGALLKMAGAALKQQESLNKAYETLSEFGAVDVSGIQGMFKNLQNMGMTVAELDKFSGILKTAGPNLATLGVTAAEGAKKFAETMAAVKNSGAERELRMLGFTSESMAKTFADYQGMMGRMGFIQGKSTQQVAKESAEYAKTLDELSKLTGQSRDELQKRMDADANDIKFRLKLQEVDEETRKRLQKASALVGEFGEDTASGFREMIANNGQVVGEASAKLMLSTGNAAKDIIERLNAGQISAIEATRLIAEAKAQQVERFRAVGKLDADIMRELGLTVKDMDAINKYRGKTQAEIEQLDRERELQAKGALDNERAAEVQRQITERNAQQAKDRLTNLIGNRIVPILETFFKVVDKIGGALASFVKFITFGKIDFTDLFKGSEITGEKESPEIQKIRDEQQKLLNERNRLNEQINDKTKIIFEETLKQLGFTEEELKDANKRKEFDKKYNENKKAYLDRRTEIDKKIEQSEKEVAVINKKQTDAAMKKATTPSGTMGVKGATGAAGGAETQAEKQLLSGPTSNLDPRLVEALNSVAQDYGKPIKINSGFRSKEDQERLYSTWVNAGGGPDKPNAGGVYMPAKPGGSKHNYGQAVDIDSTVANELDKLGLLKKHGLTRPHSKDPVHIQLAKAGGIFNGPDSGYPVLMHGKELVVPMPDTSNIANVLDSVQKTALQDQGQNKASFVGSSQAMSDQFIALQTDLMNMIASKLDMLDTRLAKSNDIQENILTYSAS